MKRFGMTVILGMIFVVSGLAIIQKDETPILKSDLKVGILEKQAEQYKLVLQFQNKQVQAQQKQIEAMQLVNEANELQKRANNLGLEISSLVQDAASKSGVDQSIWLLEESTLQFKKKDIKKVGDKK